jgi:hypothetical protein
MEPFLDFYCSNRTKSKASPSWLNVTPEEIAMVTDISTLRIEALRLLLFMHRDAEEEGSHKVEQIRSILQGFDTNDKLFRINMLILFWITVQNTAKRAPPYSSTTAWRRPPLPVAR